MDFWNELTFSEKAKVVASALGGLFVMWLFVCAMLIVW